MNAPREASPEYGIVIERAPGNYSAYVLDLPGCIATGQTVDQVTNNIRSAIAFHLEGLHDDGFPIPEPTVTVSSVVEEI